VLKFRLVYGPRDNMISVLYRSRFGGRVKLDPEEVEEVVAIDSKALRALVEGKGEELAPWAREILRWYLHLPSRLEKIGRSTARRNKARSE